MFYDNTDEHTAIPARRLWIIHLHLNDYGALHVFHLLTDFQYDFFYVGFTSACTKITFDKKMQIISLHCLLKWPFELQRNTV